MDVDTPSQDYKDMLIDWLITETLFKGQRAMIEAGRVFLPQEPGESDTAYTNRLNKSILYNYFKKSVKELTGKVFAKPISLSDDMPKKASSIWNNVDLLGNNGDSFFRNVFEDGMIHGISYVLVDYPTGVSELNLDEQRKYGVRPYFKHIKANQLIRAVPAYINGKVVPGRIHIKEVVEEPYGDWGYTEITQIRVLYPGGWEIYREQKNGRNVIWALVDSGTTTLDYIPIFPMYNCYMGFFKGISPLQDLATLNIGHWQSYSDQRNILHVARVPILFGKDIETLDEDGQIEVGASRMIHGNVDSDLKYVEHSGDSIGAGRDDIKDLEERMRVAAMEPLLLDRTAAGNAMETTKTSSSLQDQALRLQDLINNCMEAACDWLKIKFKGTATVSRDFGMLWRDGSESGILLKSRQNKSLTTRTYLKELKRRGLLAEDTDIEAEVLAIEEEIQTDMAYRNELGNQIVADQNEDDLDFGKQNIQ